MNFRKVLVNKAERFRIEQDIETESYFVSFPVFNGLAEYPEYYRITQEEFATFSIDKNALLIFVGKCKSRQMDERLLMKPGRLRGEP